MNQNTIYVGIDVDDLHYHASALNPSTGEMLNFDCRPTLKGLVGQLEKVRGHFGAVQLKLFYEASTLASRCRGYDYDVIAPSNSPRWGGARHPRYDDPHCATAGRAILDVDTERPLEALCPGLRCEAFCRRPLSSRRQQVMLCSPTARLMASPHPSPAAPGPKRKLMKYRLKSPSTDERQKYGVFSVRALSRPWLVHARLRLRFVQPIATAMDFSPARRPATPVLSQHPGCR
jgi:hypothetical protein